MGKAMKHPEKALSAAFVRTVTQPGRYADGNGLYLVVDPSGAKRWLQRIVIRGKRKDLGLGSLSLVSLAEARETALANRKTARTGGDPLAERKRIAQLPTFEEAARAAHKELAPSLKGEKDRAAFLTMMERHAFPRFGDRRISEVTSVDVRNMVLAVRERTPETARKLKVRVGQVFKWAIGQGHITTNPATGDALALPSHPRAPEHHPAVALADAARWFEQLGERDGMAARGLEFVALTWTRSGEVRGATWDEVDLSSALWVIPASRMKTGKEHRVALSRQAVDLLEALPRTSSPLIFPAPRGGQLSDMALSAVMRRIHASDVKAGGKGFLDPRSRRPAVPHGLRSTARDWAAERGYPHDMSELALAHDVGSEVERAYRRSDMLARRRGMMESWAEFLSDKATGDVIRIA